MLEVRILCFIFTFSPRVSSKLENEEDIVYRPGVKTTSTRYYVSEIMQGGKLYFLQFCDDEKMKVAPPVVILSEGQSRPESAGRFENKRLG